MAPVICFVAAKPWVAAPLAPVASTEACWALSAACFVMFETDSRLDPVSSSELACSEAPLATDSLLAAIWLAACPTWSTITATWASASWRADAVVLIASFISPNSPG